MQTLGLGGLLALIRGAALPRRSPRGNRGRKGIGALALAALVLLSPTLAAGAQISVNLGKKPVFIEPVGGTRTCAEQGGTDCGSWEGCQGWVPAADTDTCCLGGCGAPTQEGQITEHSFGVLSYVNYDEEGFTYNLDDQIQHLNYLGLGFHRMSTNKSPQWQYVQTSESGGYDFATWDRILGRLANEAGVELMATISAENPWDQDQCHPPDREGPMYPCNIALWEAYLRAAVERYDGDDDYGCSQPAPDCYQPGDGQYPTWDSLQRPVVKCWQLENEINMRSFWADTAARYGDLLKLSYAVLKERCPDCKLALAGQGGQSFTQRDYDMHSFYREVLDSLDGQYFDIIDNHLYKVKGDYNVYRNRQSEYEAYFSQRGFGPVDYWVTETGTFSGTPSTELGYQSEEDHATELVKRFVYSFASGVKKVCWAKIMEQSLFEDEVCNRFNFIDLINNPISPEDCSDPNNPAGFGASHKKLAYYTLKQLIEKLKGSVSVEIIQETDNIYVYKLEAAGHPLYVAWWDWFNDVGEGRTITLDVTEVPTDWVRITEAVPNAASGGELDEGSYPLFFDSLEVPVLTDPPHPPAAPSNPSPANGAPGVGLINPVLSWTGGDPDPGDTVTYDLYFGGLNPPPLKKGGLTAPTFTLGKLACATTFYWKVVARDNYGGETPGPVWTFTTADEGCPVIESLSPNPAQPATVVTINGHGFGKTRGFILIGAITYQPGNPKIQNWSDTKITFKLPAYAAWSSGTTQTKNVRIKAGPVGSRIVSNWVPLTITKQ